MNLENLYVGQEVKNYKELCGLLGEKVKTGNAKKYQLIDWDRYFNYEKDGHKFVIKQILSDIKEKVVKRGNNKILPFIDEMELLLIDLLVKSKHKEVVLSSSKLMLELCMINPNYHKYFANKERLSNLLNMDIGYVIDFYDTTNSTFKSAISTVTKRLENKKLIMHESITMVQFIDTSIETTPTGYTKVTSVFEYDEDNDSYVSRVIKPKEVWRAATDEEREHILRIERDVLKYKYQADTLQDVLLSGNIYNYYKDVSKFLFAELNIKKAYKANRYTFNINELVEQKIKIMNHHKLTDTQRKLNLKVMMRIDENSNKRYEKAMDQLLKYDKLPRNKPYQVNNEYVDNINSISSSLIDIYNSDSLEELLEDELLDDILD